ncbi:aldose epimerase family protein [uncultured Paraglaciecola sp.]|uniref:aldose epimerase family protein n=1 Tax=uncultured Paraglaciecola sp. TaxID=1765024 RepID=UPI0025CDD103|nr:aldose epimerase family protein [uncultured Paraglaciecola sp.]
MIKQSNFGKMPDGTIVEKFCLTNHQGSSVEILNLGGIIHRWLIPNKQNKHTDIVLGYDTVNDYLADDSFLGALIGRYANRINKGKFTLAGKKYQTDINLGDNCLHGGSQGFNSKVWQCTVLSDADNPSIMLTLSSPDGDQGFPGEIKVKVIYTLTEQNRLKIEYLAAAEQTTLYNPTNHSYFNLSGHNSGSVEADQIQLLASHYTPTDERAIPTGEIAEVDNTPFDLRELTAISQPLASNHQQIAYGNGLDHNLCLDAYAPQTKVAFYAGKAISQNSDVVLKVYTNMPGIQIFTANHFENKKGKDSVLYQAHQGVCFETQFYPDSPNQPHFPSATLEANKEFYSVTEYEILF